MMVCGFLGDEENNNVNLTILRLYAIQTKYVDVIISRSVNFVKGSEVQGQLVRVTLHIHTPF